MLLAQLTRLDSTLYYLLSTTIYLQSNTTGLSVYFANWHRSNISLLEMKKLLLEMIQLFRKCKEFLFKNRV